MTIFSLVELVMALLAVFVIFGAQELRLAGKVIRGGNVAGVGMLLLLPVPLAVVLGFHAGGAREFLGQAQAGKSFDVLYAEAVDKFWWVDPAAIGICVVLIGLVFLLFGTAYVRLDDNCLGRDGWRDPADWAVMAALPEALPVPEEEPPASEGVTTTPKHPLPTRPPQAL